MHSSRLSLFTPCLSFSPVHGWHRTLQAVGDNRSRNHHSCADALVCATGNFIRKSAVLTAASVWCRVPIHKGAMATQNITNKALVGAVLSSANFYVKQKVLLVSAVFKPELECSIQAKKVWSWAATMEKTKLDHEDQANTSLLCHC